MLDRGDFGVPCYASDEDEEPDEWSDYVLITYQTEEGCFIDCSGRRWAYVTPIDTRTGDKITELST